MEQPEDAFEAGLILAQTLESAGVSYCLGGALAYGQYGIPRATKDVDINVFVEPNALTPVLNALRDLGVRFSNAPVKEAEEEGLVVGHWLGYRVDLFVPSIPFSYEAEKTRRLFSFDDRSAYFLSPEALCVFKLLFFRGKDIVDLERLVATSGKDVDTDYVRTAIVGMMGEDDPRVETWDRIVKTNHGPL